MKRTLTLLAVVFVLLPACAMQRGRSYAKKGIRKPPPTKIKFFNHSGRTVTVRARDVRFEVEDDESTPHIDQYGDDEDTIIDQTIPPFPDVDSIWPRDIPEPTDLDSLDLNPQVAVVPPYRTTHYWITATVDAEERTLDFPVPTAQDSIKDQEILVTFLKHPDDLANKTIMMVSAKYWNSDDAEWRDASTQVVIRHR